MSEKLEGIVSPSIDNLLDKEFDSQKLSKYELVIFAAKRARQINDYYQERAEGTVITAGPLVESTIDEKPLTIAMREINEGLVELDSAK